MCVVDRLTAAPSCLDQDREAFLQITLANELFHPVGAEADFDCFVLGCRFAGEQPFVSHRSLCFPSA